MKKISLFIITVVITVLLASCTQPNQFRLHAQQNLLDESWMQKINTNPNLWLKGTDPWFFTGDPRDVSQYAIQAPVQDSISHMMVRTPRPSSPTSQPVAPS